MQRKWKLRSVWPTGTLINRKTSGRPKGRIWRASFMRSLRLWRIGFRNGCLHTPGFSCAAVVGRVEETSIRYPKSVLPQDGQRENCRIDIVRKFTNWLTTGSGVRKCSSGNGDYIAGKYDETNPAPPHRWNRRSLALPASPPAPDPAHPLLPI